MYFAGKAARSTKARDELYRNVAVRYFLLLSLIWSLRTDERNRSDAVLRGKTWARPPSSGKSIATLRKKQFANVNTLPMFSVQYFMLYSCRQHQRVSICTDSAFTSSSSFGSIFQLQSPWQQWMSLVTPTFRGQPFSRLTRGYSRDVWIEGHLPWSFSTGPTIGHHSRCSIWSESLITDLCGLS